MLWLGPAEFLVVAPAESHESLGGSLSRTLTEALGDGEGQVVDLSANRTTLELSGPARPGGAGEGLRRWTCTRASSSPGRR